MVNPTVAVLVISDQTNTVVASVPMPTTTVRLAYDSKQGEIFATYAGYSNTVSVISDGNNTVIANVTVANSALQSLAYDSFKSEIFVTNPSNNTVSVISDSPLPSITPSPTSSASPSPTVPEFGSPDLILVLTAVAAVTLYTVALSVKKRPI